MKDPNGHWYLADTAMGPGDLLLITGKTLEQATAGVRKAGLFRVVPASSPAIVSSSYRYEAQDFQYTPFPRLC